MSVQKYKRKESPMEFMHNALILRKEITELMLRDFGVKQKIWNRAVEITASDREREAVLQITEKYGMDMEDRDTLKEMVYRRDCNESILDSYPYWLVEYFRESILRILENMTMNIFYANSIYITCEQEYRQRRGFWNMAVGNCYQLANWMDYIRQTLPVDANKYERYLARTDREIALIKGVRQADNRVIAKLKKEK